MIYRKRGTAIRWENGTRIRVTECGWAREGELFECAPDVAAPPPPPLADLPPPPSPDLPRGVALERFIVSRGIAEHEYGGARWTEETDRVHVALTRGALRVLFDATSAQLGEVAAIADALARASGQEGPAPPRLRLARNVTAAVLPALVGVAPPNVRLLQTAGRIDGYGRRVAEETVHFYRPSYRLRPVQMPFDLRLECDVTEIEEDRPLAVALLGPVESLVAPLLIRHGERVWPARVAIHRIDAVSGDRRWYPYGAGSFGAEMML